MEPKERKGPVELVQAGKVIGNGLDAVVRALRANPAGAGAIARRALAFWLEQGRPAVILEATELRVGDHVALTAGEPEGHWILPAFMAGLRGVRPEEYGTPEDLLRLATELGALETDFKSIARFSDWLWADGAEGFEVNLKDSFMEMIEAVDVEVPWRDPAWMAVRDQVALELGAQTTEIASRELDAAALREEFQVPLEWYAQNLDAPSLARLSEAERRQAREACGDAAAWARAEVDAAMERVQLRSAIPASRLAGRLMARLAGGPDAGLLHFLVELCQADDAYSRELFAALKAGQVGATLARSVDLSDVEVVPPLFEFLRGLPAEARSSFVQGLLVRVLHAPQDLVAACEFVFLFGLGDFLALVDRNHLTPDQAVALVRVMSGCKSPLQDVGRLLESLPDACAAAVLKQLPTRNVEALLPRIRHLLERGSPELMEEVTPLVLACNKPTTSRLAADALFRDRGRPLRPETCRLACEALVRQGLAREYLLPCVRSRRAHPGLRLAALAALQATPELLREAARWRPAELLESQELRKALQGARALTRRGSP